MGPQPHGAARVVGPRAALTPGVWRKLEIVVHDNTYQVKLDGTLTTAGACARMRRVCTTTTRE
jgi:hypothetical protein